MEFSAISKFLEKFRILDRTQREERDTLVGAIKNVTGISVSPQQVTVRGKTIFIKETPVKKTELFMKKKEILERLRAEKSSVLQNISDIR